MPRGGDLPVRTERLLNKAGGWQGTGEKDAKRQDGQSRHTHTRAENVREDPSPAFNPHPENKKKKIERNRGVEEYGMKSSFHVGVKVGRRMGNEAQQRLAPGFG